MVRVPAAWPGAVHRPRPKLAAFVHLVAEQADGGNLRQILRPRGVTHVPKVTPPGGPASAAAVRPVRYGAMDTPTVAALEPAGLAVAIATAVP